MPAKGGRKSGRRPNKVSRIVKQVIARQNEVKHVNTSASSTTSTTATLIDLSSTTTGSTDLTRVGDQIQAHSIWFKYALTCVDTTNLVRVILFIFLSDDATTPTMTDIVEDTAATSACLCPIRKDTVTAKKIRVIYDKLHFLILNSDKAYVVTSVRKRLHHRIGYLSGGTTGCGKVYAMIVSDSSGVGHPSYGYYNTFYWTDM